MSIERELFEQIRLKDDNHLFHREGQTLEFKEQFNWAGIAEYLPDFAAFANNKGGMIVFGVTDVPRILSGLNAKAHNAFSKIDPEKISGYIIDCFSGHIEWDYCLIQSDKKYFSCFKVFPAKVKPIITKKDAGKETILKNGEIYFRYGGRTQKINFPELEEIINQRIRKNNLDWIEKVSTIAISGPENSAVLDMKNRNLSFSKSEKIFVDANLIDEVNLIQEGNFSEVDGEKTLKLIGSVKSVDTVEVVKEVVRDRLSDYPLSAMQLAKEIAKKNNKCSTNKVWKIIHNEGLKRNSKYSMFNFRKASDLKRYEETGKVRSGTPSIYKKTAIDHIINIFENTDL